MLLIRNAALPTDSYALNLRQSHAAGLLASHTRLFNVLEVDCRHEVRGVPGMRHFAIQLVNLLKRETLGLVDHGVDEQDANEAGTAPDEEDFGAEVGVTGTGVDKVWRCVCYAERCQSCDSSFLDGREQTYRWPS